MQFCVRHAGRVGRFVLVSLSSDAGCAGGMVLVLLVFMIEISGCCLFAVAAKKLID